MERKNIAERVQSSRPLGVWVPSSLAALSFEPGAVFREERKSTQIPQKELFWQGWGLPPTAASSSLLPSSIHLWGAAYSPSPTPHNKTWTSILRRRADTHTCTHKWLLGHCRHTNTHVHQTWIRARFLRVHCMCPHSTLVIGWHFVAQTRFCLVAVWAGFENTECHFRQLWQDDMCVIGG